MIRICVGKDEWWPMAWVDRTPDGYGTAIEATEEEVAEYEDLCKRVQYWSDVFLSRAEDKKPA